MEFIDIPQQKTLAELGLDEFGQAPLEFTGAEVNKRAKTVSELGLPSNFIVDDSEGWVLRGQMQILLNPGQDIQPALDRVLRAGGGKVLLNPGLYKPGRNLYIGGGVTLEGAGIYTTVIDFGGGAYSIYMQGDDPYSTGTVSVTQDSTTVTGSGTTWTEEMVGQHILVDGDFYEITAFVSATQLTIGSGFVGDSQSGLTYVISTVNFYPSLKQCTVQNSSVNTIDIRYSYGALVDFVANYTGVKGISCQDSVIPFIKNGEIYECTNGVYFNNVFSFLFASMFIGNCTGDGFLSDGGGDATMTDFGISDNGGCGIKWTNTSKVAMLSFTIDSNTSHGTEFVAGCDDVTMTGGAVHTNGGSGLKLTATSDRNSVAQVQFIDNGAYGIHIAASNCDNNIILGNILSGNASGQVGDSGTTTKIRSNIGVADN